MISRARLRRAGERDLVDARMPHEVRGRRSSRAGHDVDRARREADLGRQLGQAERRQRRLRVRLEDDRAAGGQRGRELPRRHHQRVVPGHDLPRDADRLLQRVEEERPADRVRAAGDRGDRRGVEAEVLDRLAQLGLDRRDRLADVPRPRARRAPCGSRRSRRRARAADASARSAASCPSRRRARRVPHRPRGRCRPRRPWPPWRAARRSRARRSSRARRRGLDASPSMKSRSRARSRRPSASTLGDRSPTRDVLGQQPL